jgi:hypothetical protein
MSDQQTPSDEGENSHRNGSGEACQESWRVQITARCVQKMVVQKVRKRQCGEQNGNPAQDV